MTFSQSLISKVEKPKHIYATTFLTEKELIDAYGDKKMKKIFESFKEKNVKVLHGIDATKLDTYSQFNEKKFDKVIFNFPCIPGDSTAKDAQLNEIEQNKDMLDKFFQALSKMSPRPKQVEISHKCKGAFRSWNIKERCENSAYEFSHAVIFDKDLFELYENKKV